MATHLTPTPSPARRHRRRLALAAVVLTPLLAGCGTGFQAETNQIYQPGPGITDRDSGVWAINALIVTDGGGNGTLVAGLLNQLPEPDKLIDVTVASPSGAALQATIVSGTVALPPQRAVQLGWTGDVRVKGKLTAGAYCELTLTFTNAAPIVTGIPIVADTPDFDGVPVGPVPPPTTPSHSNP